MGISRADDLTLGSAFHRDLKFSFWWTIRGLKTNQISLGAMLLLKSNIVMVVFIAKHHLNFERRFVISRISCTSSACLLAWMNPSCQFSGCDVYHFHLLLHHKTWWALTSMVTYRSGGSQRISWTWLVAYLEHSNYCNHLEDHQFFPHSGDEPRVRCGCFHVSFTIGDVWVCIDYWYIQVSINP